MERTSRDAWTSSQTPPWISRRAFLVMAGALLVPSLSNHRVRGDDVAKDNGSLAKELEEMRWVATSIKLTETGADKPLPLQPTPLSRYSNPTRNLRDATLWALGEKGRPVVLLKVEFRSVRSPDHQRAVGICSLSLKQVEATYRDGFAWTSSEPGTVLHALPDAPKPAETPTQRLTQMKALARRFAVTEFPGPGRGQSELRLMPTPLHRYNDPEAGLTDGVLFAFANGTVPNHILALEARKDPTGATAWHYSFGRVGGSAISARLDGKEVATLPYVTQPANLGTYASRVLPGSYSER